jgi:hypothetical protein
MAWGYFAASIVCVIVGMRRSQVELGRTAERMSKSLEELEKHKAVTPQFRCTRNPLAVLLNSVAVGVFLVGILCLGIFVGINLCLGPVGLGVKICSGIG